MSSNTPGAAAPVSETHMIELPELAPRALGGLPLLSSSNDLLDSIEVSLSVTVGQARTTLGKLLRLKESEILTIDRKVDYPVDIVVNGNVVARGELVVVDDSFGVRVTQVAAITRD